VQWKNLVIKAFAELLRTQKHTLKWAKLHQHHLSIGIKTGYPLLRFLDSLLKQVFASQPSV
jgi:hypothetical protein